MGNLLLSSQAELRHHIISKEQNISQLPSKSRIPRIRKMLQKFSDSFQKTSPLAFHVCDWEGIVYPDKRPQTLRLKVKGLEV